MFCTCSTLQHSDVSDNKPHRCRDVAIFIDSPGLFSECRQESRSVPMRNELLRVRGAVLKIADFGARDWAKNREEMMERKRFSSAF